MFTIETSPRTGNIEDEHAARRTWAHALDADIARAAVRKLQANTNIVVYINGNRVTV